MTEFYEGQGVYLHSPSGAWVRATVRQIAADGLVGLVELGTLYPIDLCHCLLVRPGELVKGDGG